MFSKIYLVALALSVAVMAFFTYYSWSWLQSIGSPATTIAGFEYHFGLANIFLWISVFALLIVANVKLWMTDRAWAIWATLLYFLLFVISRIWLLNSANDFLKSNSQPLADPHGIGVFVLLVLCIVAGVFAFCDQFAVVRLKQKMYAPTDASLANDSPKNTIDATGLEQ
jgi:hypothetical protein